jgi:hypothetical protein
MPDEGTSQSSDWRAVVTDLPSQRHGIRRTVLAGLLGLELVILSVAVLGGAFALAAIMEFRRRRSGSVDLHSAAGR